MRNLKEKIWSINRHKRLYIFNLICIYVMLTYQTLTTMLIPIDQRGRLTSLIIVICFLYNLKNNHQWKQLFFSKPIIIWAIWCIYTASNILIQGHKLYRTTNGNFVIINEEVFFLQTILQQVIVMTTMCWLYMQNKEKTIKHIAIMFFFIAITTLLFDSTKDWGADKRFGATMGNGAALNMVSFVFILLNAWTNNYIKRKYIISCLIIAITLIFAIQTRKALIAVTIIFIFTYISHIKLKNPFTWLLIPLGLFVIFYIGDYVLENTQIGNRLSSVEEQGESFNPTNIPFLDFLGDRAIQVYSGWFIWLKHPIFGVGLQNAPYYSHMPYVFHQEYIGQLVENGIIGFIIFILFYISLIAQIINAIQTNINRNTIFIGLGYIIAILFISLTAWTYQFPHYFTIFGIIIGECNNIMITKHAKDHLYRITSRRRKRTSNV